MELINFISVYDNILPEKIHKKLLKVCKNMDWEDALIGEGKGVLNEKIRKVKKNNLETISNSMTNVHWCNAMGNVFKNNLKTYVTNNKVVDVYLNGIESMQVLKYTKKDHYLWHYDGGTGFNRTLSLIYFLNEDYEGGELCFRNPDGTGEFAIPKKQNRMVIWPSCFLYPHTVKPVINGERYSIVAWTT